MRAHLAKVLSEMCTVGQFMEFTALTADTGWNRFKKSLDRFIDDGVELEKVGLFGIYP